MALWAGRFSKEIDAGVNAFNSSISFDARMYRHDIQGSIAHATMLGDCGIISKEDSKTIIEGLTAILADLDSGKLEFDPNEVESHMFVEAELTKRYGDKTALDYAVKRDLLLHTAMAFLQGFPMLNCGDEIAQRNGWDYKNDPDRVEDSRNLHRSKFNWEDAKQRTRKGTLQNQLWQGMEQLRQMRADPCFAPDAWVTTWDSHNPGVLALVRKRGEETLVGLFNFTEYPAGASLDALGGEYHTPEGTSVWLADVELKPYQALLVRR